MSARYLDQSVAGNVRIIVGDACFKKWYSVHTLVSRVLQEALTSPEFKSLNLSAETAVITRFERETGLVEIEAPVE